MPGKQGGAGFAPAGGVSPRLTCQVCRGHNIGNPSPLQCHGPTSAGSPGVVGALVVETSLLDTIEVALLPIAMEATQLVIFAVVQIGSSAVTIPNVPGRPNAQGPVEVNVEHKMVGLASLSGTLPAAI